MSVFSQLINKDSIRIYPSGSTINKTLVIRDLCSVVARNWNSKTLKEIETLVARREASVSTRVAEKIAIPHAIIPDAGDNRVAVAVVPEGVDWDNGEHSPVSLIVLIVGGKDNHLKILSEVASVLQNEALLEDLLQAVNPDQFMSLLQGEKPSSASLLDLDLSAQIFEQALVLRRKVGPARLIFHADAICDSGFMEKLVDDMDVLIVASSDERFSKAFKKKHRPIIIPFKGVKRSAHVQFTLLYLLGQKHLRQNDVVINVYGKPDSGYLDSIRLLQLNRELNLQLPSQNGSFPEDLDLSIFNRTLQIATQLALEGREGKPVGTLFVVGDSEAVLPYTRQLIVNPFHGYPREDRNILDPSMEETIKEFARIDGAFIISGDGTIESAGTYLNGQPDASEMQAGLGARHAAALGITVVSTALAIAISESTRKISVFHAGRKIMEL